MNGLPITLKFNLELFMFSKLINFNYIYFLVILVSQICFLVFFNKNMYIVIFSNSTKKIHIDLSKYEILFFLFNFFILLII